MEHVNTEDDIDIGNWKYEGPKDFALKLIDKFGRPSYIEKCQMTNEAYSVTFKNIDGQICENNFEGIEAVCIQHEIDHLNGKLFVDHISKLKKNIIIKKLIKLKKK